MVRCDASGTDLHFRTGGLPASAMEAVIPAWAEHQSSRGLATARAFLLIRGTRGDRGVPFVQNHILEHKDSFMSAAAVFAANSAMQLLDAATEHGNAHYPREYNWAGHCEGNHKFLSGCDSWLASHGQRAQQPFALLPTHCRRIVSSSCLPMVSCHRTSACRS